MRRLVSPTTHFMLVARNSDRITAVAQDLITRGALAVDTWVMDLDDTTAHAEMLAAASERLTKIDMALIAHGVLGDQHAAEADFELAAAILHTNFISTVSLVTWLANYFQGQRSGTLAVISSVAGDRGRKSNYVYGASKGAVVSFVKGLSTELARHNILVNSVAPGWVATDMSNPVLETKAGQKMAAAAIPIGRPATAEEIAGPILFLASDLANFITGEIINVNGGSVLCG